MYFCKNCGEIYQADDAVMCTKCGVSRGQGYNYCSSCGRQLDSGQTVCLNCGVAHRVVEGSGSKSRVTAGLLGIFLGSFGVHNFYLGYTTKAVTQLVCTMVGYLASCLGIGVFVVMGTAIWGFAEGLMILSSKIDMDGQGNPLVD